MGMRRNQKRRANQGFWASVFSRIPYIAGVGLGLAFLGYLFFNDNGLPLYLDRVQKESELKKQTHDLHESNQSLRSSIDRIQHDPSELEQLARDRLGMVREGEIVYQFVEPKADSPGRVP